MKFLDSIITICSTLSQNIGMCTLESTEWAKLYFCQEEMVEMIVVRGTAMGTALGAGEGVARLGGGRAGARTWSQGRLQVPWPARVALRWTQLFPPWGLGPLCAGWGEGAWMGAPRLCQPCKLLLDEGDCPIATRPTLLWSPGAGARGSP